jgi:hypothetical protein
MEFSSELMGKIKAVLEKEHNRIFKDDEVVREAEMIKHLRRSP